MKAAVFTALSLGLLVVVALGAGCQKSSPPPTALTVEELPAVVEKAFSKAKPDTRTLASQVVAFVQAQEYPKAFQALQTLANGPDLTKEQLSVTSRATLTVNGLLQTAQSQGDQNAAQTLQNYRLDK